MNKVIILAIMFQLMFMMNAFPQTDWAKIEGNPVLTPGAAGQWDDVGVEMCSVLIDGTTYHMWYSGYDGFRFRIGHATSQDGIIWVKDTLNPVLNVGSPGSWEDMFVTSPCVIRNGATFHLWYDGGDGTFERIGHATSPDGRSWTKDPLNPVLDVGQSGSWDDLQVFPMGGSVIFDGNNYHMWFGGCNHLYNFRIGYATSSDGSAWNKDNINNPVMGPGSTGDWDDDGVIPGTVSFDGETYRAWYSGCANDLRWQMGYATSTDGITWTRDVVNNPVLGFGQPGSWDYEMAFDGSVCFNNMNDKYEMWYTGGGYYSGNIGYATCLMIGMDDPGMADQDGSFSILQDYPNPCTTTSIFEFEILRNAIIEISIFNLFGQLIETVSPNRYPKGKHQFVWNASPWPDGIYFICIQAGNQAVMKKVVKIR